MEAQCLATGPWSSHGLDVDPDDRMSLLRFFAAVSNLGEREVKREALLNLLARSPHRALVQFQLAFMAQEEARWDAAAQALEDAIAQDPDFIDAHVHLAYVHERQERWEAAAQSYGRVHQALQQRARARYPSVDASGSADSAAQANQLRDAWLRRQPHCRAAMLGLGAVFARLERWDAASVWLRRAVELEPDDKDLLQQVVAVLSNANDRQVRRNALLALHGASRNKGTLLFHLAFMDQEEGQFDEAASKLKAALLEDPDRLDVLSHLAYASERLGRWRDVVTFQGRVLQLSPSSVDAWCARGRGFEALGEFAEAEASYATAAGLDPERSETWTRLWYARDRVGNAKGAAEACSEALARRPGDRDHQLQHIAALHACGDASGALAECRRLLEHDCADVPWSRFMDVLNAFVRVPARTLAEKSWEYFHYSPRKVLALLEAALIIREQFPQTPRVFVGQGLIAWEKTMGFLDDQRFRACVERHNHLRMMVNWEWNLHVIQWAAKQALHVEGDFVELGVYRGFTTAVTADNIEFGKASKRWYLYDTFAGIPADQRTDGWPHAYDGRDSDEWFAEVTNLFAPYSNISVVRGRVPEVFSATCPERVAFVHIDLNSARAEVGALDALFDRLAPGALVVFDDYGWYSAREQFDVENEWMAQRGLSILELPTGQGLFIKPCA